MIFLDVDIHVVHSVQSFILRLFYEILIGSEQLHYIIDKEAERVKFDTENNDIENSD